MVLCDAEMARVGRELSRVGENCRQMELVVAEYERTLQQLVQDRQTDNVSNESSVKVDWMKNQPR